MKQLACSLALLAGFSICAAAQAPPAGWKKMKDQRGACQVAIPPDWTASPGNPGVASAKDVLEGMIVVTSNLAPLKPLSESLQKIMKIEKVYENTDKRVVYMSHIAKNPKESSSLTVAVPAKTGNCMSQVTYRSTIPENLAKQIALSLGPAN